MTLNRKKFPVTRKTKRVTSITQTPRMKVATKENFVLFSIAGCIKNSKHTLNSIIPEKENPYLKLFIQSLGDSITLMERAEHFFRKYQQERIKRDENLSKLPQE